MWWLYFKWQWIRDASGDVPFPQALLARDVPRARTRRRLASITSDDRQSFWYFGTLMFTMTLLLIYYLNFKLGNSQDPASQAPHEVRDRDYFFLWSFSAWGVWAALGLVYVWESIAALIGSRDTRTADRREPTLRSWLSASPALLLALVPLVSNWSVASRESASRHARRCRRHAELRRAVRRARHRGRQRHLPALVRAGGRGNSPRRRRRQHVAAQHRLVCASDHPSPDLCVRCGEGAGDLSRQAVGQADARHRFT